MAGKPVSQVLILSSAATSLRQQWLHHSGHVENSTNLGGWHAFHQRSWIPTGSQRISISVVGSIWAAGGNFVRSYSYLGFTPWKFKSFAPEKGAISKMELHLPTIMFSGGYVKLRGCILLVIFLTDSTMTWQNHQFSPPYGKTIFWIFSQAWIKQVNPAQLYGDCNLLDSYPGRKKCTTFSLMFLFCKHHRHHEVSFGVVNTFSLLLTNS